MSTYSIPFERAEIFKNVLYSIPSSELTFEEQLDKCIQQINSLIEFDKYTILKISFFIDASNPTDFCRLKNLIFSELGENYGVLFPPYSIIAQSPVNSKIAAEVCYVDSSNIKDLTIEYKSFEQFTYSVVRTGDIKEVIGAGITFYDNTLSMHDQIFKSFGIIEEMLQNEGMDLSHIVRQWNYIEEIVDEKVYNGKMLQHYQLLNDVREIFYRKYRFVNGYPSATGIGMKTGGAILEFIALSERNGVTSITNLEQIDAHKYSPMVLVGEVLDELGDKATPKFERAKLVMTREAKEIYISGTAAIKGELTLGIGDVVRQTFIIIDNITKLLSVENLENQGICIEKSSMEYSSLRIYIKDKNSAELIEPIIKNNYLGVPTLIVIADICRSDLLIEIEGMCHLKQR